MVFIFLYADIPPSTLWNCAFETFATNTRNVNIASRMNFVFIIYDIFKNGRIADTSALGKIIDGQDNLRLDEKLIRPHHIDL